MVAAVPVVAGAVVVVAAVEPARVVAVLGVVGGRIDRISCACRYGNDRRDKKRTSRSYRADVGTIVARRIHLFRGSRLSQCRHSRRRTVELLDPDSQNLRVLFGRCNLGDGRERSVYTVSGSSSSFAAMNLLSPAMTDDGGKPTAAPKNPSGTRHCVSLGSGKGHRPPSLSSASPTSWDAQAACWYIDRTSRGVWSPARPREYAARAATPSRM